VGSVGIGFNDVHTSHRLALCQTPASRACGRLFSSLLWVTSGEHPPGVSDECLSLSASAPITYVSAQLGHVNPSTTLRYYARWIPNKGRRWVDLLDRVASVVTAAAEAVSGPVWNQIWNQNAPKSQIGHPRPPEVPDPIGGPSRTRTLDPLIKSQLLYQLS
jgi:hypothetical protein